MHASEAGGEHRMIADQPLEQRLGKPVDDHEDAPATPEQLVDQLWSVSAGIPGHVEDDVVALEL
jgi:hypothetical protein